MSRRPIEQELAGLRTPRERIWEAVLKTPDGWTVMALQEATVPLVSMGMVIDYVAELVRTGYVRKLNAQGRKGGQYGEVRHALVNRQADAPRVNRGTKVTQGAATEAMWRTMKVLPAFSYLDIARGATLGNVVVKASTAKTYVAVLARAGYLSLVRDAKPGTPAVHRLSNNTGPLAPAITRIKVVFDRNTGQFFGLQTAQEVCDGIDD